jgi:NAD+ kinase
MLKIGIIANVDRDIGFKYTRILADCISEMGGKICIQPNVFAHIGFGESYSDEEELYDNSDLIICLGGDGTFLKVVRKIHNRKLPILGINLGNLGFLTDVDRNDIKTAVGHIFKGEYSLEERLMLETVIKRNGNVIARDVALNDIVISRGAISRILHVKTYINDMFVDNFPGDGLIVSSPTGSTAYTLSAGGPIVEPDTDLIIVTPICPHILYSRSFITTGDRMVRAVVDEDFQHIAMVTVDGQAGYEVIGGDAVEVRKSEHTISLVRINSRNFFTILRTKIYYRGESLKGNEI